jgi:hypothetical protein
MLKSLIDFELSPSEKGRGGLNSEGEVERKPQWKHVESNDNGPQG